MCLQSVVSNSMQTGKQPPIIRKEYLSDTAERTTTMTPFETKQ